jgi:5-formyltetrahydrofolate cyclo-ligase
VSGHDTQWLVHEKARLREEMKARLAGIPQAEREQRSAAILERLRSVPAFAASEHVFTCLSFGAEVDTWPLVEALVREDHRAVYVPRCGIGGSPMTVHPYPCELQTLSFGLQQPAPSAPALPDEGIDATLGCACLLGLAFDPETGHRLGYGRGHFDRFLARHKVTAIALAFEEQLVRGLPHDEHDVPMDVVVTEAGIYVAGQLLRYNL